LYDVSGRRVANLLDAVHGAGEVEVRWSGRGLAGEVLPSGVYYARLVAAGEVRTRRVVLLK
jgi:hypothetical protein